MKPSEGEAVSGPVPKGEQPGDAEAAVSYVQASVSATAPAGTTFVRVFAYGSASAGVHSTFAYDGMGLTAE
jgi:hypothetical protein